MNAHFDKKGKSYRRITTKVTLTKYLNKIEKNDHRKGVQAIPSVILVGGPVGQIN